MGITNHEPENSVRFLDHYQLPRVLTADLGFLLGRELYMGKHLGKLGIEGETMQQSNPKVFLNSNKRIWGFLRSREKVELKGTEKREVVRSPKGSRFT